MPISESNIIYKVVCQGIKIPLQNWNPSQQVVPQKVTLLIVSVKWGWLLSNLVKREANQLQGNYRVQSSDGGKRKEKTQQYTQNHITPPLKKVTS